MGTKKCGSTKFGEAATPSACPKKVCSGTSKSLSKWRSLDQQQSPEKVQWGSFRSAVLRVLHSLRTHNQEKQTNFSNLQLATQRGMPQNRRFFDIPMFKGHQSLPP